MDMTILDSKANSLSILSVIAFSTLLLFSCTDTIEQKVTTANKSDVKPEKDLVLVCNDSFCKVNYSGPEFTIHKGEIIDTAHRMSNLISGEVGKKLKSLFDKKKYAKVDLKKIRMTSIDMNNLGSVKLEIFIPFKRVKNPCEARTGFDHSGGWDHDPEIEERKKQLLGIALCEELEISPLIKTPENFQEYWIQWKHKDFQVNCACN
jgi:hypothetical protein